MSSLWALSSLAVATVGHTSASPVAPNATGNATDDDSDLPLRCLNATASSFNASACPTAPPDIDERWLVERLSLIVPVAVGGVVLAILCGALAFILHHRHRRRELLKTTSGYSATSFNSSVEVSAHANPALHAPDTCEHDDFSLDNDSFLHTLETVEDARRFVVTNASYGHMRAPPPSHPSSAVAVAPAPPPSKLEPLALCAAQPVSCAPSLPGSK